MNGVEIFSSHCRTSDFHVREDDLHARGYNVVMDYVFKNDEGEKFVKFFYYDQGNRDLVQISPIKKSPSIEKIYKENKPRVEDHWI